MMVTWSLCWHAPNDFVMTFPTALGLLYLVLGTCVPVAGGKTWHVCHWWSLGLIGQSAPTVWWGPSQICQLYKPLPGVLVQIRFFRILLDMAPSTIPFYLKNAQINMVTLYSGYMLMGWVTADLSISRAKLCLSIAAFVTFNAIWLVGFNWEHRSLFCDPAVALTFALWITNQSDLHYFAFLFFVFIGFRHLSKQKISV